MNVLTFLINFMPIIYLTHEFTPFQKEQKTNSTLIFTQTIIVCIISLMVFQNFQTLGNHNYVFLGEMILFRRVKTWQTKQKITDCFVGLNKHLESQSLLQCAGQFVWSESAPSIPLCSKNMTWLWEDFQNFLKMLNRICCLNPTLPLLLSWMKPGASCSLITLVDEIMALNL